MKLLFLIPFVFVSPFIAPTSRCCGRNSKILQTPSGLPPLISRLQVTTDNSAQRQQQHSDKSKKGVKSVKARAKKKSVVHSTTTTNTPNNNKKKQKHAKVKRKGKTSVSSSNNSDPNDTKDIIIIKNKNKCCIAIVGCVHGAFEEMYERLRRHETEHFPEKIDLVLCCGDMQSLRNKSDMDETIAIKPKYRKMGTFHQYYSGMKKAPYLTIFIGGNHEASAYLQELYYGGWIAPNIYYLGAAGVVQYRGLRIGGISGIFKGYNYQKGRYEVPPYDEKTLRSVYHVRNVDVARLKCLSQQRLDIMLSHDWPRGIEQHGKIGSLLKRKQFFEKDILENNLGSPANEELLNVLKPRRWFSAHLHVKFGAKVKHKQNKNKAGQQHHIIPSSTSSRSDVSEDNAKEDYRFTTNNTNFETDFLALDKCLPRRKYMQVITMKPQQKDDSSFNKESFSSLQYDLEWLSILQKTHKWTNRYQTQNPHPDVTSVVVSEEDTDNIRERLKKYNGKTFGTDTDIDETFIPNDFVMTAQPYKKVKTTKATRDSMTDAADSTNNRGKMIGNPQTDKILFLLGLDHIITIPCNYSDDGTPSIDSDDQSAISKKKVVAEVGLNEIDFSQESPSSSEENENDFFTWTENENDFFTWTKPP